MVVRGDREDPRIGRHRWGKECQRQCLAVMPGNEQAQDAHEGVKAALVAKVDGRREETRLHA